MATRYIATAADATAIAALIQNLGIEVAGISFKRDDNTLGIYDPDAATFKYVPIDNINGVTAGVAAASKVVILDANLAIAGLLVALGAAVTVQSPPLAGIAPDLSSNASGTTQSTFYPLNSVVLPANALSANGKGVRLFAMGITAANANAKDFKVTFGAGSVTLVTGSTANAKPYVLDMVIYRTAAGAQQYAFCLTIDATSVTGQGTAAADETAAWTIAVQSQNTAAAAASATGKGLLVDFAN